MAFSLPLILPGIFVLAFLIQLYFILFVHRRLAVYNSDELQSTGKLPPLSVIICARNEQDNLRRYLNKILEQHYPDFEVVVVNDCSNDESNWILKELSTRHNKLKVVELKEHERFKHGKKFAVTIGIKAAKHQMLVFTDADCLPTSDRWLRHMASGFGQSKSIVLGYSPYMKLPGFLNRYIRFETFLTAVNYLSFALKGNPYMGVGRNLAYKKELFFEAKGFASHMHIPSGDDDLFINQVANAANTAICIATEAQVWSQPKTNFISYQKQKTRHFSAGSAYKRKHKVVLSLQIGSALAFYFLLLLLIFFQTTFWWLAIIGYLFRLLTQLWVYKSIMNKLSVSDLLWYFPLLDLFYLIYTALMGVSAPFRKKIYWK